MWSALVARLDSDSYFRDALRNSKQLFFNRLQQMTEYFVMRECENIPPQTSLYCDSAFAHMKDFFNFEFPKRFLEISCRDLNSLASLFAL